MDIDIHRLAALARVEITEEEAADCASYIDRQLRAADTLPALPCGAHETGADERDAVALADLRPDAVRPSSAHADILCNAPRTREGCFAVPAVTGHGE